MRKLIAWLLILLAVLMVLGMLINYHMLWLVIDILVILGCLFSGVFLLIDRQG